MHVGGVCAGNGESMLHFAEAFMVELGQHGWDKSGRRRLLFLLREKRSVKTEKRGLY